MIGWIALVITLAVFGSIAIQIDDWSRDWTQNTAALDPNSTNEQLRPLRLEASVENVAARVEGFVTALDRWDYAAEQPEPTADGTKTIHLTRTTSLFRYVDDIEVTITPDGDDNAVVTATSQSRVGKGDLGQNPRNLIELKRGLSMEL